MVNQREASKPSTQAQPPIPKALQDLTNNPSQFGETSPLRNSLKKDIGKDDSSHLFNIPRPNQARPEHHRAPQPQQAQAPPPFTIPPKVHPFRQYVPPTQPNSTASRSSYNPDIMEIPRPVNFFPPNPPQNSRAPVEIPRPGNYPTYVTQPAPRPVYSSMGGTQGFQSVNFFGQRNTIDLTRKNDDEFDPDAALREGQDKFGAVDPYMYVDAAQANENIKALLEGAFDDEEEKIPRTRGRKKKRQQQKVEDDDTNALAKKLQALDTKAEEKEAEAEAQAEAEEDEEDDGSVEGLTVKLLPHQVDGVAWMTDKEVGVRKKNGVLPKGGILADDVSYYFSFLFYSLRLSINLFSDGSRQDNSISSSNSLESSTTSRRTA